MFECRVRLQPLDERAGREATALDANLLSGLFLPGGESARWLETACHLTDDQESIRFFPWIASEHGKALSTRAVAGAFIVLRRRSSSSVVGPAIEFRQVSKRLWIPMDSIIKPDVDATFVEQSLALQTAPSTHIVFWHPAQGLVPFTEDEGWSLASLLRLPETRVGRWESAIPAVYFPQQLVALRAGSLPSWEAGGNTVDGPTDKPPPPVDIGTKARQLGELPPAPQEPRDTLWRRLAAKARRRATRMLHGLANQSLQALKGLRHAFGTLGPTHRGSSGQPGRSIAQPSSLNGSSTGGSSVVSSGSSGSGAVSAGVHGGQRNWLEQLRDWTQRRLAVDWNELENKRQREIERLLSLLQNDPDQGLDYAIPLARNASGRGGGLPTSSLPSRNLDHRSRDAESFGASNGWVIAPELRWKLETRYRELAKREVRLRRYRRAANLYGVLLGDWEAAAKTLEAGGHYLDAGEIIRDRLNNAAAAADCFRRGGRFEEALELWRSLKRHSEAADMLRGLGRETEAIVEYRLAVQQLCVQADPVGASIILMEKLREPDEALALLARSWPYGIAARRCFEERLRLLQSLGRVEAMHGLLRGLPDDPAVTRLGIWPLEAVARLVHQHPTADIRDTARDVVLVIAGRQLAAALAPPREDAGAHNAGTHDYFAAAGLPATSHPASTNNSSRDIQALLAIVEGLSTGDWLLKRDCQRVGDRYRSAARSQEPTTKRAHPSHDSVPTLVPAAIRTIDSTVDWCWAGRVPLDPTSVYAVARDESNRLSIVRWPLPVENVGGRFPTRVPLPLPRTSGALRMVLRLDNTRSKAATLLVLDDEAAARGAISKAGEIESATAGNLRLENVESLRVALAAPGLYDYFCGLHDRYALIGVTNDVVLKRMSSTGELLHTQSLALPFNSPELRDTAPTQLERDEDQPAWQSHRQADAASADVATPAVWRVAEIGRWVCVAHGRRCLVLSETHSVASEHLFSEEVRSLTVSRAHSRIAICVGLRQGAVLQRFENDRWRATRIHDAIANPLARFLPSGLLVLAGPYAIEVHDPNADSPRPLYRGTLNGQPVALLSLSNRQFAVLTRQGDWLRYSV